MREAVETHEAGKCLTPQSRRLRLFGFVCLAIAAATLLWCRTAIAQPLSYHHFADQRTIGGVPHFWNVISNVPFLLVGALGLRFVFSTRSLVSTGSFVSPAERWPYALFFVGVALTSFGSAYYHLDPTND